MDGVNVDASARLHSTPRRRPCFKSSEHISKQEGEKLTTCRTPEGQEFPREFASKPGTGHVLSVWMREKP